MNDLLYGSICLTDIPKELITKSERNGKQYLNIAVPKLKSKGKFNETHAITVNIPKDQRKPDDKTIFIGSLKTWEGSNQTHNNSSSQDDDLPF